MHTEVQKAWLAGFIDGEGHIGITVLRGKYFAGRHTMVVAVFNTHIPTLRSIELEWPGSRVYIRERNTDKGWRASGTLRWNTQNAVRVLREVQPYLRTKAEQAIIALKFADTLRPKETIGIPISEEEWTYRDELKQQIHILNGRFPEQRPDPRMRGSLTCVRCGQEFTDYQRRRKYCTKQCAMAAGRKFYEERQLTEKVCLRCGSTFQSPKKKQVYCSWICGRHGGMDKWKESIAAKKRAAKTE